MERECIQYIKEHEKTTQNETKEREENEKTIQAARSSNDAEEIFNKILEKSIYDKARDKSK